MRKTIIMTIAAAALTAGCGGGDSAETTAQATESSTSAVAPESATAAAPSTTAQAMDAETALATLKGAGLPITDSAVITETNDANDLIGRPGQYVSKVAFADSRLGVPIDPAEPGNEGGGSIEVFADGADGQVRSDYIQQTLQSLGPIAGTEYHYLAGSILVRVTGELPPSVAAEYEAAVAGCPETTESLASHFRIVDEPGSGPVAASGHDRVRSCGVWCSWPARRGGRALANVPGAQST